MRLAFVILSLLVATAAQADLRITRDTGGYVEAYKARYEQIRDRGGRVVIDGVCNSACTVVLGIVPRNRICVTPRASSASIRPITTRTTPSASRSRARRGRRS